MTKRQDPEVIAMRACWKALGPFNKATRSRMLRWLIAKSNTAEGTWLTADQIAQGAKGALPRRKEEVPRGS